MNITELKSKLKRLIKVEDMQSPEQAERNLLIGKIIHMLDDLSYTSGEEIDQIRELLCDAEDGWDESEYKEGYTTALRDALNILLHNN